MQSKIRSMSSILLAFLAVTAVTVSEVEASGGASGKRAPSSVISSPGRNLLVRPQPSWYLDRMALGTPDYLPLRNGRVFHPSQDLPWGLGEWKQSANRTEQRRWWLRETNRMPAAILSTQ